MARLAWPAAGALLAALTLAPRPAVAQYARGTAVGLRAPAAARAGGAPERAASAAPTADPSRGRHLWGGALLGGAAAGVAHVLYIRQQPKGQYHDVGYVVVPASVVLGGAVGAGVGYLVYRAHAG